MFEKVSTSMDFAKREEEVLQFWQENQVFEKSGQLREGAPEFTFYDGPPTANGKPHIGHVLTRAFKDIVPRYRTMKGYHVLRKAGWDTHGLPVELEVEKLLGISGKPQIESYGIEPFIKKCKESVWKYKTEWEQMSQRVGYWADMENPYVTYDNNYIESVWWSIKQLFDKGLLYKGHKVVPYCPRCGTALSSHEVAQGYKDVEETSVIVRFPVVGQEGVSFLAWTTTPWTLPSNVALCVNPAEDYAYVSWHGETLILAKALVASVLDGEGEITKTVKGSELLGMAYQPLFEATAGKVQPGEKAFIVVGDGYVTLTDGTGIVHQAPAFGEDDARVGRENGLAFVQMVDEQGCFTPEVEGVAGMFVKDGDPIIIDMLRENGRLFKALPYTHSYPFCWRCDTPLIYYARSTWFIAMTRVRDELLKNNASINWMPDNIKDGRMGNFLSNVIDWGLSRERYWGTPLPIWECACGHRHAIGSIEELRSMSPDCPEDIELHKPYIDRVHVTCPECGGAMKRVHEVIDCWYDSGSMPFAQWHYPFENKEIFDKNFPADYISEAVDQTRGWFYTLLAISTLLFGRAPYKNCIVLGHVNDKDGIKMSKHKGNVIDPWTVLDRQGADAVRWYFYTGSAPWLPSRFSPEAVGEAQRKFMGTLWNTYAFFLLYASIDGFDPNTVPLDENARTLMDKWILSRLQQLVAFVDEGMMQYKITETGRAIGEFVDDLSNWYVRLNRGRYWGEGMDADKAAAYHTLYTVLDTLSRVIAPYVPFMAETMYQNLGRKVCPEGPISVHLCDFPQADTALIDQALSDDMARAMGIIGGGRAARSTAGIKVRQPLSTLYVQQEGALPQEVLALIAEELNVKQVCLVSDARAYTTYRLKPQLRTLGRKYGKLVPGIGKALAQMDGNAAMDALEKEGALRFEVDGQPVELAPEDVLSEKIEQPGYAVFSDRDITVALDTNLTPQLIDEGNVREVISKVQTQRKEMGFEVTDRIHLTVQAPEALARVLEGSLDTLLPAVLAAGYTSGAADDGREWDINGQMVRIAIQKA
nr:isoleucine--tRNA ligase [bacterium]